MSDIEKLKERYSALLGVANKIRSALEEAEQLHGEWQDLQNRIAETNSEIEQNIFQPFIDKGIIPGSYFKIENSDKIYKVVSIRHCAYGVIDISEPEKIINAQLDLEPTGSTINRFIPLPDYKEVFAPAESETEQ